MVTRSATPFRAAFSVAAATESGSMSTPVPCDAPRAIAARSRMPLPVPTSSTPGPLRGSSPSRPSALHFSRPMSARRVVGCKPVPNAWPGSIVTTASPGAVVCSRHGGRTTMRPTRRIGNSARQLVAHSSAGIGRTSSGPMPRRPTPPLENAAKRSSSVTSVSAAARLLAVSGSQARMRTGAVGS